MPSPNEVLPSTPDLKPAAAAPAPPLSPTCEMEHAYPAAFDHGVCIGCGGAQPTELAGVAAAPVSLRVPEALDVQTHEGTVFVCFGPARARLRIGMGVPEAHNLSDCIARAEAAGRSLPGAPFDNATQAAGLFPGLEEYRMPNEPIPGVENRPRGTILQTITIQSDELIAWGAAPAEGGAVALGFVVEGPPTTSEPSLRITPHQRLLLLVHDARAFGGRVLRAAAVAQSHVQGVPYEGPSAEDDQRLAGQVPLGGRA